MKSKVIATIVTALVLALVVLLCILNGSKKVAERMAHVVEPSTTNARLEAAGLQVTGTNIPVTVFEK